MPGARGGIDGGSDGRYNRGMAQNDLPSEERVRELTADPNLSAEDANRYADLFIAAGRYPVALMFLERSKDGSRLDKVKTEAVALGDAFFLHRVNTILPDRVSADEWRSAGERARSSGKLLFAKECYRQCGDEEKLKAVEEDFLKILRPPATISRSSGSAGETPARA